MESLDKQERNDKSTDYEGSKFREEVFSKAVRAGKRTYFFDVKATRKDEFYLTITESKKRFDASGKPFYEKHKIFLYKEDFEKFVDGITEIVDYIKERQPVEEQADDENLKKDYSNIEFEDLSK